MSILLLDMLLHVHQIMSYYNIPPTCSYDMEAYNFHRQNLHCTMSGSPFFPFFRYILLYCLIFHFLSEPFQPMDTVQEYSLPVFLAFQAEASVLQTDRTEHSSYESQYFHVFPYKILQPYPYIPARLSIHILPE